MKAMSKVNDSTPVQQNTTGTTTTLSQLNTITEAFTGDDFTKITSEDFKKNPLAGRMMAMLYAEKAKKLKEAEDKVIDLTKLVGYYQSFPAVKIGYAVMNIIGTIVVGLGVSLSANIWLIVSGGLLVLSGNILPLMYTKKNKV